MKREVKCRGFHKFGGISGWVYGSLLKDGETYYINLPHTSYNVDPESIGEYTGLKDMFHKEIYEGDKVKILEGTLSGIYTIEMKFGCWGFDPNRGGDETDFIKIGFWIRSNNNTNILSQVEILGNIYELKPY